MSLTLITAPVTEPLSLDEEKLHLRVDDTADDTLITVLIQAARERVEAVTRRALVTQTWELTLDAFPCDGIIRLARPPLVEVDSVMYVDAGGDLQTLDAGNYVVDTASLPGAVRRAYGVTWPTPRWEAGAVRVRYDAGYGDAAAVPASLKAAILLVLGDLYENREAKILATGTVNENATLMAVLGPYRYLEVV